MNLKGLAILYCNIKTLQRECEVLKKKSTDIADLVIIFKFYLET